MCGAIKLNLINNRQLSWHSWKYHTDSHHHHYSRSHTFSVRRTFVCILWMRDTQTCRFAWSSIFCLGVGSCVYARAVHTNNKNNFALRQHDRCNLDSIDTNADSVIFQVEPSIALLLHSWHITGTMHKNTNDLSIWSKKKTFRTLT